MTREQAIEYLVFESIFSYEDIGTDPMEFYIKTLTETHIDNPWDVDRYAHLNTLFGYDIGVYNWSEIDSELWGNEKYWDNYGCGVEILELTYTDKGFIQNVCKEIGLDLSFDKWRTEDFKCYEYY